ncbi:MAG: DUF3667 domain-containing protein [Bacteroidetes bacterium]|nr:DUF3667 domain-containing protein [Bacteroidota bacterium]
MSHLKERKENNCLNCGENVIDRFCHKCGQENVEVKESFGHLIMHFIEDLTHFDGKLWKTLKLLLFKPAKLTQLYMDGQRANYIHPIRMYLFISTIFFLFIFSGEQVNKPEMIKPLPAIALPNPVLPNSVVSKKANPKKENRLNLHIGGDSITYQTILDYDSAQLKLPTAKKDSWFESSLVKKSIELNNKFKDDKFKFGEALMEQFQHYFSRMLYISLPMFALFLWVLYRRNKNHYFVDHLIFSLHIYCAFFIILFVLKLFNLSTEYIFHKPPFGSAAIITSALMFFYLYKALRNHFNQSRAKTVMKFLILNILTAILMAVLMLAFILLSLFNL